jgi:hypothetical protein
MNEPARYINVLNCVDSRQGSHRRRRGYRNLEAVATLRPTGVVVLDVPGEDALQMNLFRPDLAGQALIVLPRFGLLPPICVGGDRC